MNYSIKELSKLAGVSVRTLQYYDDIGLLSARRHETNDYRFYDKSHLLILQQILFFKELDFSLKEIIQILSSKSFDLEEALESQKKLLLIKQKRLNKLIETIDKTFLELNSRNLMNDQDLFKPFNKEEMNQYQEEARQKWGHTKAYKQSTERVKKMGKEGLQLAMKKSEKLNEKIAQAMLAGIKPNEPKVQQLIDEHYNNLRTFYEPNLELYKGLADMYIEDERFKAYYEKVAEGLAQYMHEGMMYYVEKNDL